MLGQNCELWNFFGQKCAKIIKTIKSRAIFVKTVAIYVKIDWNNQFLKMIDFLELEHLHFLG